jgi:glycosyltransferase involved in cell wall biosynthesis
MIGPVWSNRAAEAERLGQLPNVHFLGPRPYAALPAILEQFDVCLIPHTQDQLTLSMDPIKLYDYLACGKPIVSTAVSGVERFSDVLHVTGSPSDFIEEVGVALGERDPLLRERRREYARQNAWPARAAELWALVQERLAAATTDSTRPQLARNGSSRASA